MVVSEINVQDRQLQGEFVSSHLSSLCGYQIGYFSPISDFVSLLELT